MEFMKSWAVADLRAGRRRKAITSGLGTEKRRDQPRPWRTGC